MMLTTRNFFASLVLLLLIVLVASGQNTTQTSVRPLRNSDILRMVEEGKKSADIISRIMTSSCRFDIFPPVLRDLARRGVPETVVQAMTLVPNGPAKISPDQPPAISPTTPVQIPAGTVIEVETAQAVTSAKSVAGDQITFLVSKRVFLRNLLVIERGAIARATIVRVRRAGAWGRPGLLAWTMTDVTTVDGTRIPLAISGTQTGANRVAAVAGGALATGALIFPYTSPVALIWGLKKGDDAVLRGSKIFSATVKGDWTVAGLQPRPGGAIYHDMSVVKESAAPPTSTNFDRGRFKPGTFKSVPN